MKVYIGPYRSYWSVYSWFKPLYNYAEDNKKFEKTSAFVEKWIEEPLSYVLQPILDFVWNKRRWAQQKRKIRIDPWDTWDMDSTLADIIFPMLKQLQKEKHGAPCVKDVDVPEHLRSTTAKPKKNEWDIDEFHFDRWDYVLNEMIWAFEQLNNPAYDDVYYTDTGIDKEKMNEIEDRISNGLILFGKYYRSLWD